MRFLIRLLRLLHGTYDRYSNAHEFPASDPGTWTSVEEYT